MKKRKPNKRGPGRPPGPNPVGGRRNCMISKENHFRLRKAAEAEGVSMYDLLNMYLEE